MPMNLTDVDEFTDPITAPVGTDVRDAASFRDPLQQLANRTRNLLNAHGAFGGLCIDTGGGTVVPPVGSFTSATWWNTALPVDEHGIVTVNLGADGLFVTEAGIYEAHAHFFARQPLIGSGPPTPTGTVAGVYTAAIGVAGVASDQVRQGFRVVDDDSPAWVAFSGVITVGAGELVTVRVRSEDLDGSGGPYGLNVTAGAFWLRRLA